MLRAIPALVLLFLTGCSAYLPDYRYSPEPAAVVIPPGLPPPTTQPTPPSAASGPPAMTVLGTVYGIRRADDSKHLPEAVDVRLRLENGATPATFDPTQARIVTSSLVTLGPAEASPAAPVELAPGQSYEVAAMFPLPAGMSDSDVDLSGLRLSVPLTIGAQTVQAAMNFQRIYPYAGYYPYYGPYYYGYPTYYGGVYYRRRW
jgi:hypothetical protein